jgi:hypothetical protein
VIWKSDPNPSGMLGLAMLVIAGILLIVLTRGFWQGFGAMLIVVVALTLALPPSKS